MDRAIAPVTTERQKVDRVPPRTVCQTDAISIAILTKPMQIRLSRRSPLPESDDDPTKASSSASTNIMPSPRPSSCTPTMRNARHTPSIAHRTPSRSSSKSPGNKLLREIQSNLSPQYMRTSTPGPDTPCSRYGRQQKPKEPIDCMANDILAAVMRKSLSESLSPKKKPRTQPATAPTTPAKLPPTPPPLCAPSPAVTTLTGPGSPNPNLVRTTPVYVSPIEKLIARNRNAVSMARSPHSTPNRLHQHSSDSCSSSGSSTVGSASSNSAAARPKPLPGAHLSSRKLLNFDPGSNCVVEVIAEAATAETTPAASPSPTSSPSTAVVSRTVVAPRVASSGRAPIVVKIAAAASAVTAAPAVAYQSPRRNKLLPLAPLFSETTTTTTVPKIEPVPQPMPSSSPSSSPVEQDFEDSIISFRVDITDPELKIADTTDTMDTAVVFDAAEDVQANAVETTQMPADERVDTLDNELKIADTTDTMDTAVAFDAAEDVQANAVEAAQMPADEKFDLPDNELKKADTTETINTAVVFDAAEDMQANTVEAAQMPADDRVDSPDNVTSPFRNPPLKTYRGSRKLISIDKQLDSAYPAQSTNEEAAEITEVAATSPIEREDDSVSASVVVKRATDPAAIEKPSPPPPPPSDEPSMHSEPAMLPPPPSNTRLDRCPSVDSARGSSIVTEDEPVLHNWHEGQIAWARIGNYPFWPSILCNDPNGNLQQVITRQNGISMTRLHVRYFADNGRRNWIPSCNVVAFVSFEDFERMRNEPPPKGQTKAGFKIAQKAFTVSAHNRNNWQRALLEAQTLSTVPLSRRLRVFEDMVTRGSIAKPPTTAKNRRVSVASQDISFGNLFNELDLQRERTSTPSLEPRLLSRSPTPDLPESPAYEELSMRMDDDAVQDADNKVHSYLRSISAHTQAAPTATTIISSCTSTSSTSSSSSSSGIQSVAEEQDEAFVEFYRTTRESILGDDADDVEQLADDHLKMLVLKMWQRKVISPARSPAPSVVSAKRKRTSSTGSASSAMTIARANRTITGPSNPATSRPASCLPVRRSIRDIRPTVRITSEAMQQEHQQRATALAEQQKSAQSERNALRAQRQAEKEVRDVAEMSQYYMREHPKNILFRGLSREPLCRLCLRQDAAKQPARKCHTATCNEYVHAACAALMRAGVPAEEIAMASEQQQQTGGGGKRRKIEVVVHVAGDHEETALLDDDEDDHGVVGVGSSDPDADAMPAYCPDCWPAQSPVCFVCKAAPDGSEMRCTERQCGRHYHEPCLKYWPQSKVVQAAETDRKQVLCPCHICHICVSDDPRGKHYHIKNSQLLRCVRCPATYHNDSACIPAGSQILTATQLICPRHRVDSRRPVNADWCFICAKGGELICCETCPTAFHAECLKVALPDRYICEECETGRLPLYGECVWAKMANCRWWPAVTVPPMDIPTSVLAVKHRAHEFVLRFFGSHDYCWMSRGFVFLYQDGDSDCGDSKAILATMAAAADGGYLGGGGKESKYQKALVEAKAWFERFRALNAVHVNPDRDRLLKPLPYIKCRNNRPVAPVRLAESNEENSPQCECRETDEDPCGATCWNRALQIECAAGRCRAGARCQNQRFERREYPNLAEQRMEGKGWGLVTLEPIAAGDFIIEYVGELINRREFDRRIVVKQQLKEEHYYFLTLSRELLIDAGPRGNSARFINHSCEPNCETQVWQVQGNQRVGLFALEDIAPNTELTFNYNLESIGELKKTCHCGARRCAGFIGAKYLEPGEEPNRKKSKKSTTDTDSSLPTAKKKAVAKSKKKPKKKAAIKVTEASTTITAATTAATATTTTTKKAALKRKHASASGQPAMDDNGIRRPATPKTTKAALKRKHQSAAQPDMDDNENNRPEQPRATNNKRMKLDPSVE